MQYKKVRTIAFLGAGEHRPKKELSLVRAGDVLLYHIGTWNKDVPETGINFRGNAIHGRRLVSGGDPGRVYRAGALSEGLSAAARKRKRGSNARTKQRSIKGKEKNRI